MKPGKAGRRVPITAKEDERPERDTVRISSRTVDGDNRWSGMADWSGVLRGNSLFDPCDDAEAQARAQHDDR